MKIAGIIFLVVAALNFVVAIAAAGSGASDAAGMKFSAAALIGVIGLVLYLVGKGKDKNKKQ